MACCATRSVATTPTTLASFQLSGEHQASATRVTICPPIFDLHAFDARSTDDTPR